MDFNLAVFCSGIGSNLKAINDSINNNILKANISVVVISDKNAQCIEYCKNNNLTYVVVERDPKSCNKTRKEYYDRIIKILDNYQLNLIGVCGCIL